MKSAFAAGRNAAPGPRSAIARCATIALLLVPFAGCGSGVTVPGFVGGGENRPPVILTAYLQQTASGRIRMTADVFEPDADGLTVRYDQVAGPFAAQESSTLVGGSLGVVLRPDGDGLYAFRIVASDGFFNAVANVSINIGSGSAVAEPADLLIATPPLPSGRFRVRYNGRVVADEGTTSFALDGVIELNPNTLSTGRVNDIEVKLGTDSNPYYLAAPAGSLSIESDALLDVGASVDPRLATAGNADSPVGPAEDTLLIRFEGPDIVMVTDPTALSAPGLFRPDGTPDQSVRIASVLIRLRPSGDRVSGTIYASSRPTATADLPRFAEYQAEITGTRTR